MRTLIFRAGLAAGAALALSACGGNKAANNVTVTNELDANTLLTAPANDASAVESVTNVAQPTSTNTTSSNSTESSAPPPSANNVEANTVGM